MLLPAPRKTSVLAHWFEAHPVDGHDHGRHHGARPTKWTYFESALMSREMSRL
jgi:hypothetical protein